jgi:hypothetical protein
LTSVSLQLSDILKLFWPLVVLEPTSLCRQLISFAIMVRIVCNMNSVTTEVYCFVSGKFHLTTYPLWVRHHISVSTSFPFRCTSAQTSPPTRLCVGIHTVRLVLHFRVLFNLQLCLLLLLWKFTLT